MQRFKWNKRIGDFYAPQNNVHWSSFRMRRTAIGRWFEVKWKAVFKLWNSKCQRIVAKVKWSMCGPSVAWIKCRMHHKSRDDIILRRTIGMVSRMCWPYVYHNSHSNVNQFLLVFLFCFFLHSALISPKTPNRWKMSGCWSERRCVFFGHSLDMSDFMTFFHRSYDR